MDNVIARSAKAIVQKSFGLCASTKNEVEKWRACTNSFHEIFCKHTGQRLAGKRGFLQDFFSVGEKFLQKIRQKKNFQDEYTP